MVVTKQEIVDGLRKLGLKRGDIVIVHSGLSTLGTVDGGADTVIDALLEVLGDEGTLVMPTLSSGVFDVEKSRSNVGAITEVFRKRPGVLRSMHPSHSVAAYGARAGDLIKDHIKAPTAYGPGTPYHRLLEWGGKILLLGVDQDRNTCLHTIEALVNAPYLKTVTREYIDEHGEVKTLTIEAMAGPHRDFIGLDKRFREAGIMNIGKIGRAVCRLIDGPGMMRVALQAFEEDPAAVLCDNPACLDCRRQRGLIKHAELQKEDFKLSVVSDEASQRLTDALEFASHEGARAIELRQVDGTDVHRLSGREMDVIKALIRQRGFHVSAISARALVPDATTMLEAACAFDAPAIIIPVEALSTSIAQKAREMGKRVLVENRGETSEAILNTLKGYDREIVGLAFNPAEFARAGEKPFLKSYRTQLRRWIRQLYILDGLFDGTPRLVAQGNGEVKELMSILRCRSFDGYFVLRTLNGSGRDALREVGDAFWATLRSL